MKFVKLLITGFILCFSLGAHQVAHADPFPIGQPIYNYTSKICLPVPDIVITIIDTVVSGEPIVRKVRVKRRLCEYRDADGELLGWGYETYGTNWY